VLLRPVGDRLAIGIAHDLGDRHGYRCGGDTTPKTDAGSSPSDVKWCGRSAL
jgi:hypothetical protein